MLLEVAEVSLEEDSCLRNLVTQDILSVGRERLCVCREEVDCSIGTELR